MANPTFYEKLAADIVQVSAAGDDAVTQDKVAGICWALENFLISQGNIQGYSVVAAFMVSLVMLKRAMVAAKPDERVLIEGLIKSIIGSFGEKVH